MLMRISPFRYTLHLQDTFIQRYTDTYSYANWHCTASGGGGVTHICSLWMRMYLPDTKTNSSGYLEGAVNHMWKSKNEKSSCKNAQKLQKKGNVAQQQLVLYHVGVGVGIGRGRGRHVVYLFVIRLFVLSFVCRLFVALDTYCK